MRRNPEVIFCLFFRPAFPLWFWRVSFWFLFVRLGFCPWVYSLCCEWYGFLLVCRFDANGSEPIRKSTDGVLCEVEPCGGVETERDVLAGEICWDGKMSSKVPRLKGGELYCRATAYSIAEHWPPGAYGAFSLGLHHGAFCLGAVGP